MCLTTNQSQSYSVFFKSWRQIRLRLPAPIVVTSVPIYIFIRHFSLVLMGASFQIVKGNILGLVVAETKVWLVPVSDRQKTGSVSMMACKKPSIRWVYNSPPL